MKLFHQRNSGQMTAVSARVFFWVFLWVSVVHFGVTAAMAQQTDRQRQFEQRRSTVTAEFQRAVQAPADALLQSVSEIESRLASGSSDLGSRMQRAVGALQTIKTALQAFAAQNENRDSNNEEARVDYRDAAARLLSPFLRVYHDALMRIETADHANQYLRRAVLPNNQMAISGFEILLPLEIGQRVRENVEDTGHQAGQSFTAIEGLSSSSPFYFETVTGQNAGFRLRFYSAPRVQALYGGLQHVLNRPYLGSALQTEALKLSVLKQTVVNNVLYENERLALALPSSVPPIVHELRAQSVDMVQERLYRLKARGYLVRALQKFAAITPRAQGRCAETSAASPSADRQYCAAAVAFNNIITQTIINRLSGIRACGATPSADCIAGVAQVFDVRKIGRLGGDFGAIAAALVSPHQHPVPHLLDYSRRVTVAVVARMMESVARSDRLAWELIQNEPSRFSGSSESQVRFVMRSLAKQLRKQLMVKALDDFVLLSNVDFSRVTPQNQVQTAQWRDAITAQLTVTALELEGIESQLASESGAPASFVALQNERSRALAPIIQSRRGHDLDRAVAVKRAILTRDLVTAANRMYRISSHIVALERRALTPDQLPDDIGPGDVVNAILSAPAPVSTPLPEWVPTMVGFYGGISEAESRVCGENAQSQECRTAQTKLQQASQRIFRVTPIVARGLDLVLRRCGSDGAVCAQAINRLRGAIARDASDRALALRRLDWQTPRRTFEQYLAIVNDTNTTVLTSEDRTLLRPVLEAFNQMLLVSKASMATGLYSGLLTAFQALIGDNSIRLDDVWSLRLSAVERRLLDRTGRLSALQSEVRAAAGYLSQHQQVLEKLFVPRQERQQYFRGRLANDVTLLVRYYSAIVRFYQQSYPILFNEIPLPAAVAATLREHVISPAISSPTGVRLTTPASMKLYDLIGKLSDYFNSSPDANTLYGLIASIQANRADSSAALNQPIGGDADLLQRIMVAAFTRPGEVTRSLLPGLSRTPLLDILNRALHSNSSVNFDGIYEDRDWPTRILQRDVRPLILRQLNPAQAATQAVVGAILTPYLRTAARRLQREITIYASPMPTGGEGADRLRDLANSEAGQLLHALGDGAVAAELDRITGETPLADRAWAKAKHWAEQAEGLSGFLFNVDLFVPLSPGYHSGLMTYMVVAAIGDLVTDFGSLYVFSSNHNRLTALGSTGIQDGPMAGIATLMGLQDQIASTYSKINESFLTRVWFIHGFGRGMIGQFLRAREMQRFSRALMANSPVPLLENAHVSHLVATYMAERGRLNALGQLAQVALEAAPAVEVRSEGGGPSRVAGGVAPRDMQHPNYGYSRDAIPTFGELRQQAVELIANSVVRFTRTGSSGSAAARDDAFRAFLGRRPRGVEQLFDHLVTALIREPGFRPDNLTAENYRRGVERLAGRLEAEFRSSFEREENLRLPRPEVESDSVGDIRPPVAARTPGDTRPGAENLARVWADFILGMELYGALQRFEDHFSGIPPRAVDPSEGASVPPPRQQAGEPEPHFWNARQDARRAERLEAVDSLYRSIYEGSDTVRRQQPSNPYQSRIRVTPVAPESAPPTPTAPGSGGTPRNNGSR